MWFRNRIPALALVLATLVAVVALVAVPFAGRIGVLERVGWRR